jgi:signal transduction histidine kinase
MLDINPAAATISCGLDGTGRHNYEPIGRLRPVRETSTSFPSFSERWSVPTQVEQYIVIMQLPIVLLLVIVNLQAVKAFGEFSFRLVAFGWLANLGYLLFGHAAAHPDDAVFSSLARLPSAVISQTLDAIAAGLFLLATSAFLRKNRSGPILSFLRKNRAGPILVRIQPLWIIVTVAGALAITLLPDLSHDTYGRLLWIPLVVIEITSLLGLSILYKRAFEKRDSNARTVGRFLLVGGTTLYALIQPLALLTTGGDWVEVIGYSVGLISKSAMLIGLAGGFIMSAESTVRAEALQRRVSEMARTVGRITHELGTPIRHLDVQVSKLRRLAPAHGDFTIHLVGLEQTVLRVDAVIEATLALLPKPETLIDITSLGKGTASVSSGDRETANVNTLLQLALMVVKETRGEQVTIRTSFSGNCCISCIPFQLVGAFINLLRNAYDAIAPYRRGTIMLITRNLEGTTVEVEILDDGHGVPDELIDVIFDEGYSTRSGPGRGYGLALVQAFVTRNGGCISFSKPPVKSTERPGTSVLMQFPKVKCLTREERLERSDHFATTRHR